MYSLTNTMHTLHVHGDLCWEYTGIQVPPGRNLIAARFPVNSGGKPADLWVGHMGHSGLEMCFFFGSFWVVPRQFGVTLCLFAAIRMLGLDAT